MIQAEMNESIDYNNFVTTYIDDTFFIFKHCLDRVLAQVSCFLVFYSVGLYEEPGPHYQVH